MIYNETKILQNIKTGKMSIEGVLAPIAKNGGILVKNYYSLISAGTERTVIGFMKKSLIGKVRGRTMKNFSYEIRKRKISMIIQEVLKE